jgi:nucleoside-triphosphatase
MRKGHERVGFRLETLDGQTATLAHVDLDSTYRVGRYRVDVPALERMVESVLIPPDPTTLFVVDEIGKMECFSPKFIEAVTALLDSHCLVLATVARTGSGFIERVKNRPDVEHWEVTRKNRNELPGRILAWLQTKQAE